MNACSEFLASASSLASITLAAPALPVGFIDLLKDSIGPSSPRPRYFRCLRAVVEASDRQDLYASGACELRYAVLVGYSWSATRGDGRALVVRPASLLALVT